MKRTRPAETRITIPASAAWPIDPNEVVVLPASHGLAGARARGRFFAERPDESIAQPWARRSSRLQAIVHHVGLALGGRPGQSLARCLLLPASKDTLLRVVRRCSTPRFVPPTVIGIDDWAWRRNQRYGTIICDLERRRTIALLPDREPATAERARTSLVASFANSVIKDQAAVSAAITSPWSNGQTEGQITKLKLVKPQMYGRGKIDLLQARVIAPDKRRPAPKLRQSQNRTPNNSLAGSQRS
jgi:hypothetical protein